MKTIRVTETSKVGAHALVLIDGDGSLFLTCAAPWWWLRTWLAFWLLPGAKIWSLIRTPGDKAGHFRRRVVRAVHIGERIAHNVAGLQ